MLPIPWRHLVPPILKSRDRRIRSSRANLCYMSLSQISPGKKVQREKEKGRREVRTGKWVDGKERDSRDSTLGNPRQEGQHMFVAILGHTHPETLSQENKQKRVLSDFLGLQSTRILCQFPGKR